MGGTVAAITKEKQLLIIGVATNQAGLKFYRVIVVDILDDHRRIDLGNLDSVLHGVGRQDGAYHEEN